MQSVGVVGWFTGGGHGPLSSTYGMGSDNLLEATLVTPNSTIITANTCQYADLFYALRGGGGGTYGVVTSVVMKAYPSPQTSLWTFSATLLEASHEPQWWDLVTFFHQQLPEWKSAGLQGYYYLLGPPLMPTRMLALGFYLYDKPNGTVEKLIAPWTCKLETMGTAITSQSSVKTAASFMEIYHGVENEAVAQGGGFSLGSRLLPAEALHDSEALSHMLQEVAGVSRGNAVHRPPGLEVVICNADEFPDVDTDTRNYRSCHCEFQQYQSGHESEPCVAQSRRALSYGGRLARRFRELGPGYSRRCDVSQNVRHAQVGT